MKNIRKLKSICILLSICILFASCHTTQTITVNAPAGTKIYTPSKSLLGTTSNNGKLEIEIDSDTYYPFFLSKANDSNDYIPFALDYKNKNYNLTKFGEYIGKGLAIAGTGVLTITTIALAAAAAAGDDDITTIFGITGGIAGGVTLLGVAIGRPCEARADQTQYEYQYKYLSTQTTNCDIKFTQPNFEENLIKEDKEEAVKEEKEEAVKEEKKSTTTNNKKENSSIANIKLKSEKSAIKLNNHARTIAGEYVGSGKITKDGTTIEKYDNAKIILEYIDKNNVNVSVEIDGEKFFSSASAYKVDKAENGYKLTHSEISKADISIDKANNLIYIHQRVNIEGDIYTLTIKAKKQ